MPPTAKGALFILCGGLLTTKADPGLSALDRCNLTLPPASACSGAHALSCYGPREAARVLAALRALPLREVASVSSWNASTASPRLAAFVRGAATSASCALVGSAPFLLRERLGAQIDAHDFVLRANFAPTTPKYAAHVGSRTDARLMAHAWVDLRARTDGTVIIHGPEAGADDRAANGRYNIVALGAALADGLGARGLKLGVSGGMRGALLCLRLCGSLTLYGFDLDGRNPGHYYDDEREGIVPAHLALAAAEPARLRTAPATLGFGGGRKPLRIELVRDSGNGGGGGGHAGRAADANGSGAGGRLSGAGGLLVPQLRQKGGLVPGALNAYVRNTYNREPHSMRYRHNFEWERLVLRALGRAGCLAAHQWDAALPGTSRAEAEAADARNVIAFRRAITEGRHWGRGSERAAAGVDVRAE